MALTLPASGDSTTKRPPPGRGRPLRVPGGCSAGLAVQRVALLATAVLLELEPVGVVAPVLLGDVVALLALRARQSDLRADVGALGGHGGRSLSGESTTTRWNNFTRIRDQAAAGQTRVRARA